MGVDGVLIGVYNNRNSPKCYPVLVTEFLQFSHDAVCYARDACMNVSYTADGFQETQSKRESDVEMRSC
jgi:hypothetical protein